jgi:nucleoid-associated protein YgaU
VVVTDRRRILAILALDLVLAGLLRRAGSVSVDLRAAVADPQRWLEQVGPDAAAAMLVELLGWAVLAWVTVGLLLVLGATVPGVVGRAADALAMCVIPAAVRRAASLTLGVSISTVAVVGTAAADSTPARTPVKPAFSASHAADLLPWSPSAASQRVDWPLDPAPPAPPRSRDGPAGAPTGGTGGAETPGPGPGGGGARAHHPRRTGTERTTDSTEPESSQADTAAASSTSALVRPGDCLWLIAARRLGPGASAADVAREWPRWYAANRQVIGADPDVIQPGQRLDAPPRPGLGGR